MLVEYPALDGAVLLTLGGDGAFQSACTLRCIVFPLQRTEIAQRVGTVVILRRDVVNFPTVCGVPVSIL